ncbi:MAG: hypothetical protein JG766_1518 [Desulfacinum sp.]|jgi:hypothetical protein|nr:hypothetical protein [Desulfacinum sp.]
MWNEATYVEERGTFSRRGRWPALFLGVFLAALPRAVWATQVHAEPEGLYAHQLAHAFFLVSMGILVYWLRERHLTQHRGWRYLQYAAIFFILWNVDTMFVHHLEGREDLFLTFSKGTLQAALQPFPGREWLTWAFYLGKMDHLLCVPAILFLYLSLRELIRTGYRFPRSENG